MKYVDNLCYACVLLRIVENAAADDGDDDDDDDCRTLLSFCTCYVGRM